MKVNRKSHFLWAAIVLLGLAAACQSVGPSAPGTAQLSTQQAYQATQIGRLESTVRAQGTQMAGQAEWLSYLSTSIPAQQVTPQTPEPTPYQPVTGSVVIAEQACCAGGTVGAIIRITVAFEGVSPFAEVVEMRVMAGMGGAAREADLEAIPWEPFAPEKTFPITIQIANWIGFYVSAQFRDAAGNLSPVLWDDISIEGHLPPP